MCSTVCVCLYINILIIIMIHFADDHFINYCVAPVFNNRAKYSRTIKLQFVLIVCKSTDRWALGSMSKLLHVLLDFLQTSSLAMPAGHPESSLKTCES